MRMCARGWCGLTRLDAARKRDGCRAFEPRDGSSWPSKTAKHVPRSLEKEYREATLSHAFSPVYRVRVRLESKNPKTSLIVHFDPSSIKLLAFALVWHWHLTDTCTKSRQIPTSSLSSVPRTSWYRASIESIECWRSGKIVPLKVHVQTGYVRLEDN